MDPVLCKLPNKEPGDNVTINCDKFTIGRAKSSSFVIVDPNVSRIQCTFEKEENSWYLNDSSLNGTTVNDSRYTKRRVKLSNNDIIELTPTLKYQFLQVNDLDTDNEAMINFMDTILEEYDKKSTETASTAASTVDLTNSAKPAADVEVINLLNESASQPGTSNSEVTNSSFSDELMCSICTELFIKTVTLNCQHSFCNYCIEEWKKTNKICPICRGKITHCVPTLTVDNIICKIVDKLSKEERDRRDELVKERAPAPPAAQQQANKRGNHRSTYTRSRGRRGGNGNQTASTSNGRGRGGRGRRQQLPPLPPRAAEVIDVSSSDYDDEDWLPEELGLIYGLEDYNGIPGAYYGGYGSCHRCHSHGHWANGCPN